MHIKLDNLTDPRIIALLEEHLKHMYSITPPESVHALDIESLKEDGVTFWSAWEDPDLLLGCGAMKALDSTSGEIESMRTVAGLGRRGVASALLNHIIEVAQTRRYRSLYLETGSMEEFMPARQLYEKFGFTLCEPFADYSEDPNSVYYCLVLQPEKRHPHL